MHIRSPKKSCYWSETLVVWLVAFALFVPLSLYAQDNTQPSDEQPTVDFMALPETYVASFQKLIAPIPEMDINSDAENSAESNETGGLLILAEQQMAIANQHTGFLNEALNTEKLEEAFQHTEHIVNILDGMEGEFFGDLDQDGQAQNPGNGIGLLSYLNDAMSVAEELAETIDDAEERGTLPPELAEQSADTLIQLSTAIDTVTQIQSQAIDLLSTDNLQDMNLVAQDLSALIESLADTVSEANTSTHELALQLIALETSSSTAVTEEPNEGILTIELATLRSAIDDDLTVVHDELSTALEQLGIAIQHTEFLHDAITDSTVEIAHQHTEHIVNILDGATGELYGDLDLNGQVQNPGDGVGVLTYQRNAQSAAQSVAEAIIDVNGDASESRIGASSDEMIQLIGSSVDAIVAAEESAIVLFGVTTAEEIAPIADEIEFLIQQSIDDISQSLVEHGELQQLLSLGDAWNDQNVEKVLALQEAIDGELLLFNEVVTRARGQLGVARQHTEFLQNSLSEDDLPEMKTHTEHVSNILDGKDGQLFGDLNGDGQVQNPGDGVGVKVYLSILADKTTQLLDVFSRFASDDERPSGEIGDSLGRLNILFGQLFDPENDAAIDASLVTVSQVLLDVSISSTIEESTPLAEEVETRLASIDSLLEEISIEVTDLESAIEETLAVASESQALVIQAPDADAFESLTKAADELDLAFTHIRFLNDAIELNDLSSARTYVEHVINILEGQDGIYYGDLDGNGEAQNPGDTIGVRTHLEESLRIYNELTERAEDESHTDQIQTLLTNIANTQRILLPATEIAYKIFAVDTTTEAEPFLTEVTERISAAVDLMATTRSIRIESLASTTDSRAVGKILGAPPYNPEHGEAWSSANQGSTYIFIAGGAFTVGADSERATSPREQPAHDVVLDGFWMQQTETTNAQYGYCVLAGACTPPHNNIWNQDAYTTHPVQDIDWTQAMAYAQWVGARLPTEVEWEVACRGGDERLYPWGDDSPDESLANFNNNVGDTSLVGAYPDGATEEGLLDMSGNVWEWSSTLNRPYPYTIADGRENLEGTGNRVVRGGSYSYTKYQASCIARTGFNIESGRAGIRLVLLAKDGEWVNPIDNARYILVRSGEFIMGASEDESVSTKDQPQHTVDLADFWIQQTETTNGQYAACVTAGACTPPANDSWNSPDLANLPVTDVSWVQANDYATYVGGRLPTEAEWEKACRGSDGRLFPWGNDEPTNDLTNFDNLLGEPAPVGSYLDGASPFGLFDMSGNVWEWTSSLDSPYPYVADDGREDDGAGDDVNRIMRGGSFYYTRYQVSCIARSGFEPNFHGRNFGFRVLIDNP